MSQRTFSESCRLVRVLFRAKGINLSDDDVRFAAGLIEAFRESEIRITAAARDLVYSPSATNDMIELQGTQSMDAPVEYMELCTVVRELDNRPLPKPESVA